jgi:G3E family GTPase
MTLSATDSRARYIMIGGFLGAGKSTAILKLAQRLRAAGRTVGLITNDQGIDLVDTAFMRSHGFDVEEIAGGCFCCRFDSLKDAADRLTMKMRPDVFIAEPVGSCTDLIATVSYPLRRLYGDAFSIAPLSVVLDPTRARRVLGLDDDSRFSSKVRYIYRKQIEEADLIVINKIDGIDANAVQELTQRLKDEFPDREIRSVSARTEIGLPAWFDHLLTNELKSGNPLTIDYETYAEGEALLGWLNATLTLQSPKPVEGTVVLESLANRVRDTLTGRSAEIAHMKMTLAPDDGSNELAVLNLVRNDVVPEASQALSDPLTTGELVLNVRAECDATEIRAALDGAITKLARRSTPLSLTISHVEQFQPAPPKPTHRDTSQTE